MIKETKWALYTLGIAVILTLIINLYYLHFLKGKYYGDLKVKSTTKTLIIGASQGEQGLDTKYLEDTESITKSAESLGITLIKLEKVLETKNSLENIVLTLPPFALSTFKSNERIEQAIFKKDNRADALYFLGLSTKEKNEFMKKYEYTSIWDNIHRLKPTFPLNIKRIMELKKPLKVGTVLFKGKNENTRTIKESLEDKYGVEKYKISTREVESLSEIIEKTEKLGINFIILLTPEKEEFRNALPSNIEKDYIQTINQLLAIHKNLYFQDYRDFELIRKYEKEVMFNRNHLNNEGAFIFSLFYSEVLKQFPNDKKINLDKIENEYLKKFKN